MITYRVLARLLGYPDEALVASVSEMRRVLWANEALSLEVRKGLGPLLAELESRDLLDLQAVYVGLFDRIRTLSLHLFEHVHGESRDRGQAMVELVKLYQRHGLDVTAKELPDHLPLFLEFLSVVPAAEARNLLAEASHIIAAVGGRLAKRESPYAGVFAALAELAGQAVDQPTEVDEPDTESPEAIDREWEEAAVAFGPESTPDNQTRDQDCGRVAAMLERMNVKPAAEARRP
ncbi:MAG TPA: nitrate reductase molybdenum cofactor assembly chaperone [Vineibacter sp.]|nr:nitrate reductase molybdenum cofactor assembly chaperone [Vineibacter sp.]